MKQITSIPLSKIDRLEIKVTNCHKTLAQVKEDPIPWVSGMDCEKDKYYLHDGVIYRAKQDMKPCVWEPGTDNNVWLKV